MEHTRYLKIYILELMNFAKLNPEKVSINWYLQIKNTFNYFNLEEIWNQYSLESIVKNSDLMLISVKK